jgi:hypothetical protein
MDEHRGATSYSFSNGRIWLVVLFQEPLARPPKRVSQEDRVQVFFRSASRRTRKKTWPELTALDGWIARQHNSLTRPEAIRRLVEQVLRGVGKRLAAPESRRLASYVLASA